MPAIRHLLGGAAFAACMATATAAGAQTEAQPQQ